MKKIWYSFERSVPVPYVFTMFLVVPLYLVLFTWVVWTVETGMYIDIKLSYVPYLKLQNCHELSGKSYVLRLKYK